ncbi:hypothetical protein GLOIN_2v1817981 [Rhizophagus irregularis DAOM 181602=DAOM 197198]|nr:hypothetical protein GLOIN_2v1817981 [Rhizophagus irregularis DAOM 181602=DAOM 197198]
MFYELWLAQACESSPKVLFTSTCQHWPSSYRAESIMAILSALIVSPEFANVTIFTDSKNIIIDTWDYHIFVPFLNNKIIYCFRSQSSKIEELPTIEQMKKTFLDIYDQCLLVLLECINNKLADNQSRVLLDTISQISDLWILPQDDSDLTFIDLVKGFVPLSLSQFLSFDIQKIFIYELATYLYEDEHGTFTKNHLHIGDVCYDAIQDYNESNAIIEAIFSHQGNDDKFYAFIVVKWFEETNQIKLG